MKIVMVGRGLVGLATAYAHTQLIEDVGPRVCDKEPTPGAHQCTHNSGVPHVLNALRAARLRRHVEV